MADEKSNEKPDEMTDGDRLRNWMDSVAGNVGSGAKLPFRGKILKLGI